MHMPLTGKQCPTLTMGTPGCQSARFRWWCATPSQNWKMMFFGRRITPPFLFPVRPWKKGTGNKLIKLQTLREWERERERQRQKQKASAKLGFLRGGCQGEGVMSDEISMQELQIQPIQYSTNKQKLILCSAFHILPPDLQVTLLDLRNPCS